MYNRSYYEDSPYRRSLLSSSPLRNKSPLYGSPSVDQDLSSFRLAQERQREQEFQHERALGELRRQALSLRQEIESVNEVHYKDQQMLRDDHELKMSHLRLEKEEEVRQLQMRVEEVNYSVQQKRAERDDVEKQCRYFAQENSRLRVQVGDLKSELEHVKVQVLDKTKSQVSKLEREKQFINEQHQVKLENLNADHKRTLNALQSTIDDREDELRRLQDNLNSLRKDISDKNEAADKEITGLEKKLDMSRNELQDKINENGLLKKTREEYKGENKAMMIENNRMTRETAKTLRENQDMEEEISRLNKLVYGRNFNS